MKKLIPIAVILFLFALSFSTIHNLSGKYFNSNDFYFHFYKANGNCYTDKYSLKACENYPPLYHWIAGPFSNSKIEFIYFNFLIICLIIPLIMYQITKSHWTFFIYFASGLPFILFYASIFAQAFLCVLFALLLRSKTIKISDFIIFFLGALVHSKGVWVLAPVLFYKLFCFYKEGKGIIYPVITLIQSPPDLGAFLKVIPPPIWPFILTLGLPEIILIVFYAVASFILADFRAILFIPLLLSVFLPKQIEKAPPGLKILTVLGLALFTCLQFALFITDTLKMNL